VVAENDRGNVYCPIQGRRDFSHHAQIAAWSYTILVDNSIYLMACLHGAIVAAISRATDRRDRLHVCLHDAIVAAIGRATDRRDDRRDDRTV